MGVERADLDLLGDGADAANVTDDALGRHLLGQGRHMSVEGDHALLHGNADMGHVDARLPLERIQHILLNFAVGLHGSLAPG